MAIQRVSADRQVCKLYNASKDENMANISANISMEEIRRAREGKEKIDVTCRRGSKNLAQLSSTLFVLVASSAAEKDQGRIIFSTMGPCLAPNCSLKTSFNGLADVCQEIQLKMEYFLLYMTTDFILFFCSLISLSVLHLIQFFVIRFTSPTIYFLSAATCTSPLKAWQGHPFDTIKSRVKGRCGTYLLSLVL